MQINMDALLSLQIFLDERHASAYSDVTKEGLSIFGDPQTPDSHCMLTRVRDPKSHAYPLGSRAYASMATSTQLLDGRNIHSSQHSGLLSKPR